MNKIVLFIILFISISDSQTKDSMKEINRIETSSINFNFGLKFEPFLIYSKRNMHSQGGGYDKRIELYGSIYLIFGLSIRNSSEVQFCPGFINCFDNYKGIDLSLNYKYFSNPKIYLLSSFVYHFATSYGNKNNAANSNGNIPLFGLGAGYKLSPSFSIDICLYKSLQEIVYSSAGTGYIINYVEPYPIVVYGLLKIGINLDFR
jgi:hypothetical protein